MLTTIIENEDSELHLDLTCIMGLACIGGKYYMFRKDVIQSPQEAEVDKETYFAIKAKIKEMNKGKQL